MPLEGVASPGVWEHGDTVSLNWGTQCWGIEAKYHREQGNMKQFWGSREQNLAVRGRKGGGQN